MKSKTNLTILLILITIITMISIGFKIKPIFDNYDDFNPEAVYKIKYTFFFKSDKPNTTIRTYIPKNNLRQTISREKIRNDTTMFFFKKEEQKDNIRAIWNTKNETLSHSIEYEFVFSGKSKKFKIPKNFIREKNKHKEYLTASKNIQSDNLKIADLAIQLRKNTKNDREVIKNVFDYVYKIPSAPIITLTDAITTLEQNIASCNGKSRLFVALLRSLGYPSRIKGGIILENTDKRTSHAWAEVLINEVWVPFDTLNNHFAYLPAKYLEIYHGDKSLITHTKGIQFDYIYQITQENHISFLKMNSEELNALSGFSLWNLVDKKTIPIKSLHLLLLLPIGGLLIAFLRNIVGLKTFGVFLPVLIALSLLHTGFLSGIAVFVGLIIFMGLISYPFDRLGLLYTPKLVISLTIMVAVIFIATSYGLKYDIEWLTKLTFFPIIILTIAAERFSSSTVEDGYLIALHKLLQTIIATTVSYFLLSLSWLPSILILFPEIIVLIIVISVFLGRYIGIRWIEIFRFNPILKLER
ncbi:7TM domain-containing protein [Aquimarina muelleri]|uniref:7TM domain-containing protein n=1 Tax=Aquimarina muelleri TaxID=279356 RepID=UPI003F68547A